MTRAYRLVSPSRLVGLLILAVVFGPGPARAAAAEECPNAQLRFEDRSLLLPDCRAYEMVSPVEKNGGAVARPATIAGGGVLQAAASGEAATFSSAASFGEGAVGAPVASQYLARRGASGWASENITGTSVSGAYGEHPEGVPYQLFSEELDRGLLLDGRRCGGAEACPRGYSLREGSTGELVPLPAQAAGMRVLRASPDLGRIFFENQAEETFAWSGAGLVPAPLLPPGAGPGATFQTASSDGSIIFYTESGTLFRYAASAGSAATLASGVTGVLGASADGSDVYYQTTSGLFRWDEGETAEVAAGAGAAEPGDWPPAVGTARVSPDGANLAFLSSEPLTGYDNLDQGSGEPDSELFLYSAPAGGPGSLRCLSCNPDGERPDGPSTIPGALANGEGPDATRAYKPRALSVGGDRVFFDSEDQIVPADASGFEDVYEWEAPGVGGCQVGGRGYSAGAGGCVYLISSGSSSEASEFVDASADGRDVFFLTGQSLIATDPGSVDLYDARELGGFPLPESQIACEGDACQAVPIPPQDPGPGTLVAGRPNPPVHFPPAHCAGHKHRAKRHGKTVCVAARSHRRHHHRQGVRR